MHYIPTKELIEEILKESINKIETNKDNYSIAKSTLRIHFNNSIYFQDINIYELAHKCKEWAKSQKLFIISFPSPNEGLEGYWANLTNNTHKVFAATEPEAIFKICQWIIDNRS